MIRLGLGLRNKVNDIRMRFSWALREQYALHIRRHRTASIRPEWEQRIADEIKDWKAYFEARGEPHFPKGYRRSTDPAEPLQGLVTGLLESEFPPGSTVRILDVGAGPLTWLGKVWDGRKVEITPVDALADDYDRMLAECGITPIVRTRKADSERLTEVVEEGDFDLAHARNCLDHGYDPLEAIRQMTLAVKPRGQVLLHHVVDEAEREGYYGLHQWNFCRRDDDFVIWNRRGHVNVNRELADLAEMTRIDVSDSTYDEEINARGVLPWITVVLRRRDPNDSTRRGS